MNTERKNTGHPAEAPLETHGRGEGAPSPEMVEQRAAELARIEGRGSGEATNEDRIRAKRELHGEHIRLSTSDDRTDVTVTRDPADVRAETGQRTEPLRPRDDQRIPEKEVKEGVREAEHEQMPAMRRTEPRGAGATRHAPSTREVSEDEDLSGQQQG